MAVTIGPEVQVARLVDTADRTVGVDAFGRLRTSAVQTRFHGKNIRDKQPLLFTEELTLSATSTHIANAAVVRLATVSTIGSKAIRQSKFYPQYEAGKSNRAIISFNVNGAVVGLRKSVGVFDDENGVILQTDGADTKIIRRTNVSGTPDDTDQVLQTAWNIDVLDGDGPSGITLDLDNVQVLVIDWEWLGGSILISFFIDDKEVPVHRFTKANILSTVWASNPSFPVRYEIEALTTTVGTIDCIGGSVHSEGGFGRSGIARGFPRDTFQALASDTPEPLISVRLGSAGIRDFVRMIGASAIVSTADDVVIRIVLNGTFAGGAAPVWVAQQDSPVEIDVTRTGTWNLDGQVLGAGIISANGRSSSFDADIFPQFGATVAGVSDEIQIIAQSIGSAASASGAVNWAEAA